VSSPFDAHRNDPRTYHHLLNTDPRRHPWRRWGWTPQQIAQAQHRERNRLRGAGDVVARMTKAVGIQPCTPCERRRRTLNRWFPFS
jgi:hypothetical protein